MKYYLIIATVFVNIIFSYAQTDSGKDQSFSRIVEELVGLQDLDADYEDIYENLAQILSNPININTASPEELRALHILNEKQITELITYRKDQGNLVSIYELQVIPDFDLITIDKLQPWIKVSAPEDVINHSLLKRMLQENSYLITRYERTIEAKDGFTLSNDPDRTFQGSEDRLYFRFRDARPRDFSIGFTAEKDAGEQLKWAATDQRYGFDFLSYHVQLQNKGRIRNLVVGDFQSQFGQGLVLGGAFGLGKGAESVTTTRRSNVGLLPYTSVNESGFYRGIGTTYRLGKYLNVTGFYSSITRDAGLQQDTANNISISSFQTSGFHRNENELRQRKKIREKNYGIVLNYTFNRLEAGLTFHNIHFSEAVNKDPSAYNQLTFQGKENINTGAYLNYRYNNFNFFSEAAKSLNGGIGLITGVLAVLHQNLDMAIVYRKYDRNFHPFYANALSENSQPQNETAFYWGWKYAMTRKLSFSGYTDLFKFPWLGFRRYAPASGYEWLVRISYQPSRKISMYMQAREESKARNLSESGSLYTIAQTVRRNYWCNITYSVNDKLIFKTRAQFNTFSITEKTTQGMVLLQDVNYSFGKFQINARHALFSTEDYDNRQYVYENDAWLAFSMPAYYGVGIRNYLLVEYKFNKTMSVWVRYARTRHTDREIIGSGADAIDGNIKRDVKVQVLFRF